MAKTSTYLNFVRNTEEAFNYYKGIFGTEFDGEPMRLGGMPPDENVKIADEDKELIMHIALPITGGHMLYGTDAPESMGFKLVEGNNVFICLEPDTRAESDKLFAALSEGGSVDMELADMFWGDYFGSCVDKFGIRWMVNCSEKAAK